MHVFADNAGRAWNLSATTDSLKRVRDTLNIDLPKLALKGNLFEMLAEDPLLLCDVVYVLCQPQAEAMKVSDVEFGRGLGGDAIEQATAALIEEIISFFPSARRGVLEKALAKMRKLEAMAVEGATRTLDSDQLEKDMAAALAGAQSAPTPGASSTSSRESPESTPAP